MDKQTVTRDIKSEIGNWPNMSQIAKYLGKSRNYVQTLMALYPAVFSGS